MALPVGGGAFAPPSTWLGCPPAAAAVAIGGRLCRWRGGPRRRAAAAAAAAPPPLRPAAAPRIEAAAAAGASPPLDGAGSSAAATRRLPPHAAATSAGATVTVVVPGKFDAFHAGHLALVRAAAATARSVCNGGRGSSGDGVGDGDGCAPAAAIAITLITFSGMAAALRWPPRATVVAPADIPPILRDWGRAVGAPVSLRILPFEAVRQLSPAAFLDFLVAPAAGGGNATDRREPAAASGGSVGGGGGGSDDSAVAAASPVAGLAGLGASAIVCGEDWRFGHRAAAGVAELRALAPARGLTVTVVDKVPMGAAAVSSTRVRSALGAGEVWLAGQLMGRPHRLWGQVLGDAVGDATSTSGGVATGEFVNQVPAPGAYAVIVRVRGRGAPLHTLAQVRPGGLRVDLESVEGELSCTECEVSIDFVERLGGGG
ncbi:hypothetical protein MMPV_004132 [Pyropia vietnamensis]